MERVRTSLYRVSHARKVEYWTYGPGAEHCGWCGYPWCKTGAICLEEDRVAKASQTALGEEVRGVPSDKTEKRDGVIYDACETWARTVPKTSGQQRCGGESEGPQLALWEGSLVMLPWKWAIMAKLFYGTGFKNVNWKGMDNFQMLSPPNG